jgi:hypothetical protein
MNEAGKRFLQEEFKVSSSIQKPEPVREVADLVHIGKQRMHAPDRKNNDDQYQDIHRDGRQRQGLFGFLQHFRILAPHK